ncbi:hypothetical protein CQ13_37560 [Bradyrhizobium retamae]|uniref:Uncharacterized protein n=1 Tax=Bradyrhizobium retamae TaxID=1300035 RepID=A0A0R3MBS4_9BRAD|nr:hypothetical protein [Bradyrhizobium retamae]KRR15011.1 hypothetical protein CQ13_37560 [Bradyrhizobium retamae]
MQREGWLGQPEEVIELDFCELRFKEAKLIGLIEELNGLPDVFEVTEFSDELQPERVESADPYIRGSFCRTRGDAFLDLASRLVGESENEHAWGRNSLSQQVLDSRDQRAGFSRPGPGFNEQRRTLVLGPPFATDRDWAHWLYPWSFRAAPEATGHPRAAG